MTRSSFRRRFGLILALVIVGLTLSWSESLAQPKVPVEKDHAEKMAKGLDVFKKHVRPMFVQRCVKCHGGEATESAFDLTDRDRLLKGGESGPAIIPGKGKDSLLHKLLAHTKEPYMPYQGKKLPEETVAHVAAWIDLGAPYDDPLVARPEKPLWTQKVLSAEARQFWSFQPLRREEPPAVKDAAWCKTPADRFVLAKLEAAGLRPNPLADKRQLVRRAYLDLLGLPPTPEELDAFLKDTRADAYERLLDRLLDSPHYGERWGRHWLDLVRFAESHGFEHDYDRPTAYHFRDFVIQALNQDLPYHTFVKWQLAGDEYEPTNNLALTATGYLAAGVHSTQITKNEVEKHRYDELDDIVATTGTAMLGITVGCARCHDHKYDPVPQADYYRMVSAFTTTVRSEVDLKLDVESYQKAKAVFDREHAPFAAALKKFEDEQLPARLAEWEKTWPANRESLPWVVLDIDNPSSQGGAIFTKQDDGSLLAVGRNPPTDTYTFKAATDLKEIRAIRLEALADPSLVKDGPGRAANGNFALTDIRVTAAPRGGGKPVSVKLRSARATFEQKGLPVKAAIDDDQKSAWAVDPQFGKDHAAVFEAETPFGFEDGTVLTITLQFKNNTSHAIGRPRLAVSTLTAAEPLADSILQKVLPILQAPAEKRTAEQTAALRTWYRTIDTEWRKLNQPAQEHLRKAPKPTTVKALISSEGLPPVRLHTQGDDFLKETHFLNRGDPNQKQGVAAPGYLQVLMSSPTREKHWQQTPPSGWRTSYQRRAFAEWITDTEQGAGHLLARVIVNRLWQRHLGRGIVATASDFGERGERPTHPELLDWLANELIRNGWRLKPLHKLIMTSAVYRQGSQFDEAKAKIDRDNKLLWRRHPMRLEAEVIRDSMLAVSGALDAKMFGPGTLDEGSRRRSIYFTVKRSKLIPMMQVFDAPDAQSSIGERPSTTIAPQALLMMNNPHVRSWSRSFAKRLTADAKASVEDAVTLAYRIALARAPSAEELADSTAFVQAQAATYKAAGKGDERELALADFCQVLMGLNEFVYVD